MHIEAVYRLLKCAKNSIMAFDFLYNAAHKLCITYGVQI